MMHKLFTHTFKTRAWPVWARYVATTAIVVAILLLRLRLGALSPGYPFLPFFAAIIISAVLFDRGSGLYSVILSDVLATYFLIPPEGSFGISEPRHVIGLILFTVIGIATGTIIEALHTTVRDLTRANEGLSKANERLAASESEKDLLLQEASHRMKNDLTMLAALVHLQQRTVQDETARSVLASTGERIHVLARVHDRLRRMGLSAAVDTSEFINELCDDLRERIHGIRPIALTVEIERHDLPEHRAVAVGLIINELLTNALKYAFPDDRAGNIAVTFACDDGSFVLRVADDGVGMASEPLERPEGTGLGRRLVRSMVAQLGGTFEITPGTNAQGTVATVRFPVRS